MSFLSVLLRVVLSIALVLNGATSVHAATSMQISHASPAITADEVEKIAAEAPCHQASGMAHPVPATDPSPGPSGHSSADCCKAATCACMCMQGVQAPPVHAQGPSILLKHGQNVGALSPGHTAPALLHPTRPPIG